MGLATAPRTHVTNSVLHCTATSPETLKKWDETKIRRCSLQEVLMNKRQCELQKVTETPRPSVRRVPSVVSVISIDELLYVPGYWIRGSCTSHTGDRGNNSRWHGAYESLLYFASQTIVWCARFQSLSECFWLRIGNIDMYTYGLFWNWCTPSSNAYHSSPSDTFLIKMRFGGINHF